MSESSSGDHFVCFLAGDSAACGGMLRFPRFIRLDGPGAGPSRDVGTAYREGPMGAGAVEVATANDDTDV